MSLSPDLRSIASAFAFTGTYHSHRPCGQGLINDTYEVHCHHRGKTHRYILQRINHAIFQQPAQLMENIVKVTTHIRQRLEKENAPDLTRRVLTLIPTTDAGACVHRDPTGSWWRAYHFIEQAHSPQNVDSATTAHEAARLFGEFQQLLADLPQPASLHLTIPNFHHTPARYTALRAAIAADPAHRAASVSAEIAWIHSHAPSLSRLTDLQVTGHLPTRVTHNDTKINNIMLDTSTGAGLCVMDLDTVMPGLVHYDFGDLVRTAACSTAEDERDLSQVHLRKDIFTALTHGFLRGTGSTLTPLELQHLAFSGILITLETGIRFLTDYLHGDTYFKTTRPGQNLDRFRVQQRLATSIQHHMPELEDIVAAAGRIRQHQP